MKTLKDTPAPINFISREHLISHLHNSGKLVYDLIEEYLQPTGYEPIFSQDTPYIFTIWKKPNLYSKSSFGGYEFEFIVTLNHNSVSSSYIFEICYPFTLLSGNNRNSKFSRDIIYLSTDYMIDEVRIKSYLETIRMIQKEVKNVDDYFQIDELKSANFTAPDIKTILSI